MKKAVGLAGQVAVILAVAALVAGLTWFVAQRAGWLTEGAGPGEGNLAQPTALLGTTGDSATSTDSATSGASVAFTHGTRPEGMRPGGDHEGASLFGLGDVAVNLATIGAVVLGVTLIQWLWRRRKPAPAPMPTIP